MATDSKTIKGRKMKLKNKKTGEIVDADFNATISGRTNIIIIQNGSEQLEYGSLAELNEEWKDVPEEPKEIYYINSTSHIMTASPDGNWDDEKAIGNYFETKEEAEKVVALLKRIATVKSYGCDVYEYINNTVLSIEDYYERARR